MEDLVVVRQVHTRGGDFLNLWLYPISDFLQTICDKEVLVIVVVAERHDLIAKLFADTAPNPTGCYCIRLFLDGDWQSVVVDDRLPCTNKPRRPEQVFDTGLAFSRAANNQLWVCLLEKAYAKVHGSYQAISGGEIAEALLDLTGAPTFTINFDTPHFNVNRMWNVLVQCKAERLPMGCATDSDPTGQLREVGLCPTHAYSILECREIDRGFECVRLLRIRNPHGVGEWNGAWSDNSSLWSSLVASQGTSGLARTGVNDGTFWMELMHFVQAFALVDVCLAYQDWYAASFANAFCEKKDKWRVCEAIYTIECEKSTPAYLMALQATKRGAWCRVDRKKSYKPGDLCLIVGELDEFGICKKVHGISIGGSISRGDAASVVLEAGRLYTVFVYNLGTPPTAAEVTKCQPFTVRIYSKASLRVKMQRFVPAKHGKSSTSMFHSAMVWLSAPPPPPHHDITAGLMYSQATVQYREIGHNCAVIVIQIEAVVIVLGVNQGPEDAAIQILADVKVMVGRGRSGILTANTEGAARSRADNLNQTVVDRKTSQFSTFRYPAKWKSFEVNEIVPGTSTSAEYKSGCQRLLIMLIGNGVQAKIGKVDCTAVSYSAKHQAQPNSQAKLTTWIQRNESSSSSECGLEYGLFSTMPFKPGLLHVNYKQASWNEEANSQEQMATAIAASVAEIAKPGLDEDLQAAIAASISTNMSSHDSDLQRALALSLDGDAYTNPNTQFIESSAVAASCSKGLISDEDSDLKRALALSLQNHDKSRDPEPRGRTTEHVEKSTASRANQVEVILIESDDDDICASVNAVTEKPQGHSISEKRSKRLSAAELRAARLAALSRQ